MGRKNEKRGGKGGKSSRSSAGGPPSARRDARDRDGSRDPDKERESGESEGGGGTGLQIRDRSGKVHVIGGKGRSAATSNTRPDVPASSASGGPASFATRPARELKGRAGSGHSSGEGSAGARGGDRGSAGRGGSRGAGRGGSSARGGGAGGNDRGFRPRRPQAESEIEVVARPARPGKAPATPRGPARGRSEMIRLKASVDKNRKGFGFLAFENRQYEDAFVPPREAQSLFHGDRVEVTISPSGEVHEIKVLQHRFREITGRYMPHPAGAGRGGWLVYERKKSREEVFITELKTLKVEEGDWLRAKLVFHEEGQHLVTAEIQEVYGKDLPPSADVGMIANEYNLIEEHPEDSEAEAREKKLEVPGKDLVGREDLRNVPFITIDGETARDFDDAVYVEREGDGYILWVAIADVSHYVLKGSALDKDAFSRATSVYFPERAFHMLPRALSENLCSLRPNEPRLTMVSRMKFDRDGKRESVEVMEAVIQSKRRATYNEIQAEWDLNRTNKAWEFAPHFALYQLMRKQRSDRGSIDFDLPEAELLVEKTGEVISIKNRARVDAHRLIEEFMIAANEAVTDWAMERKWPFVYRVHDVPAMQSLEKFQTLAGNVGVDFSIGDASPKVMSELVKRLAGHPAQELLNTALLRSMKQAIYSSTHGGHFGLASEGYTHFTSPIRRYPDLLVHRVLRAAVRVEKGLDKPWTATERQKLEDDLAEACEHCSYRERLASDAERESIKLKQVRLMMKHLGDEFEGKINGMTENGMFAQLDDPFVEGMIHKDTLDDDFYQFDDQHMIFFGKRKRRTFRMGDRIKVRVARADIDLRMIDFELIEGGGTGKDLPPGAGQGDLRRGRGGNRGGESPRGGGGRSRGRNRDRDDRGGAGKKFNGKGAPARTPWSAGPAAGAGPVIKPVEGGGAGLGRSDQRAGAGRFIDEARPRKGKHDKKGKRKKKR